MTVTDFLEMYDWILLTQHFGTKLIMGCYPEMLLLFPRLLLCFLREGNIEMV